MDASPRSEWVSIQVACALVGVSRRTIYNWLAEGRLSWDRTCGGCMRIDPASLWADYRGSRRPWGSRSVSEVMAER